MATIDIKTEDNLLIVTVTGELSAEEIISIVDEYYPAGIIKDAIWDLSNGSLKSISKIGFREIAIASKIAVSSGARKGCKTVYIGNDDIEYWLLRMYSTIAETSGVPIKYNVFRTFKEAKNWIELDV